MRPATASWWALASGAVCVALVVTASVLGGGWGFLVPGLVHRYAVGWAVGERRPAWRGTFDGCCSAVGGWPWGRPGGGRPGPFRPPSRAFGDARGGGGPRGLRGAAGPAA